MTPQYSPQRRYARLTFDERVTSSVLATHDGFMAAPCVERHLMPSPVERFCGLTPQPTPFHVGLSC